MASMAFIRFIVSERHPRSEKPMAVFSALYRLERDGKLEPHELEWFHQPLGGLTRTCQRLPGCQGQSAQTPRTVRFPGFDQLRLSTCLECISSVPF